MIDVGNKRKSKWISVIQIFTLISSWILFPVIFAVVLGGYLDRNLETKPFFIIIITIIAFTVSSFGIIRTIKKYSHKL